MQRSFDADPLCAKCKRVDEWIDKLSPVTSKEDASVPSIDDQDEFPPLSPTPDVVVGAPGKLRVVIGDSDEG